MKWLSMYPRRGTIARRMAFVAVPLVFLAVSCTGPTHQAPVTPRPEFVGPSPSSIELVSTSTLPASEVFTLENAGNATLTYGITDVPAWLLLAPASSALAPGGSMEISVTADCSALSTQGPASGGIGIVTNDPARPNAVLNVSLTCQEPTTTTPVASFVATPTSGEAPLDVAFDASASFDPDGSIEAYTWDFGDGTTGLGAQVEHTYAIPGTYTVELEVFDDDGANASVTDVVVVGNPTEDNNPPVASVSSSLSSGTQEAPVTVAFTVSASDPDGDAVDLAAAHWTIDGAPYTGETVDHTFDSAGTFNVSVSVEDERGGVDTFSTTYRVVSPYRLDPSTIVIDAGDPDPTVDVIASGAWTLGSDVGWIVPTQTSGSGDVTGVTLDVDASNLSGTYAQGTVTLTSNVGGFTSTTQVTVDLPHVGSLSPTSLSMSAPIDTSDTSSFTVGNAGRADLVIDATTPHAWLDVSPTSTTVGPNASRQFAVAASCGSTVTTRNGYIDLVFNDPDRDSARIDVSIDCTAAPTSAFSIEVEYYGSPEPSATQKQAFERAAARWAEAIVGDLPDVTNRDGYDACPFDPSIPAISGTIDDLRIYVAVVEMDGTHGILGRAGPCRLRGTSDLPYTGMMELDRADLNSLEANGLLEGVILHEMGHVIGIGTLWEHPSHDYVEPVCRNASTTPADPRFTGVHATFEHESLGETGHPHVEEGGGSGTRCGHWDEDHYGSELMTGWVNYTMQLSRMTIGSLEDMGYVVNYAAADTFSTTGVQQQGTGIQLEEQLIFPTVSD